MSEENPKEVVISTEDSRNIREFFTHFKIDMPPYLTKALDDFEANPSVQTQDKLRSATCEAVVTSNHPILKDELFAEAFEASKDITFREKFDRDLNQVLQEGKEEQPEGGMILTTGEINEE